MDVETMLQAERQLRAPLPPNPAPPTPLAKTKARAGTQEWHWSLPDPLNKSCTVHTLSIPLPRPLGQDRVRQGHPWRPETEGHPGSEEQGRQALSSRVRDTVRPAGRERLCAHTPESGGAGETSRCARRLRGHRGADPCERDPSPQP